jgi:hypothetical protein
MDESAVVVNGPLSRVRPSHNSTVLVHHPIDPYSLLASQQRAGIESWTTTVIHLYASELNMSGSGTIELPDGARGRMSYKLHSGENYDESDVQISGTKSLFNKNSDDDVLRIHATPTIYCDCKYSCQLKYDHLLFYLWKRVKSEVTGSRAQG